VSVFLLLIAPILGFLAKPTKAGDINSCKYLVVTDFSADPYGIANELRAQARVKGFLVVSAVSDVSPTELLRSMVNCGESIV